MKKAIRFSWVMAMCAALTLTFADAQRGKPDDAKKTEATKAAAPAAKTDARIVLVNKAKKGQIIRSKSSAALVIDAGPAKMNLDVNTVEKVTITEVAENGNITAEQVTESTELSLNGNKMPNPPEDDDKTVMTIRPDGTLVSYSKPSKGAEESEEPELGRRLFNGTRILYTTTAVGVGDKWSKEFKADTALGTPAGRADYEIVGSETVVGTETFKVKLTYRETEGDKPITVSGHVWVEKSSGDSVISEFQIDNVPFGPPSEQVMASGKFRSERTEGSPLGASASGEAKPEAKKEKTIDETVKDFEKIPGIVTLYRKKEAGRDTIHMEIREDQLGKLMMLQATASTGNASELVAGNPINDLLFRFERRGDDQILMVTPNIRYRAQAGTPIARVVQRSYPNGFYDAFKIEAKQPDRKSLLINVSELFRGDIAEISSALNGIASLLGGGGGFSLDREKTAIDKIKNFPENLVVETDYHFAKGRGGGGGLAALFGGGGDTLPNPRSFPFRVVYNLHELKEDGYQPRHADPRVGFFTADHVDVTDDSKEDQNVRYVLRWRLEKKDPKAEISEPKKPITFWMDNGIPLEYRDAVRAGILSWNKAFEGAGFKNAIEVKQMPDDADWDHADMRYNVIRWVSSPGAAYAVALFRVNPITGEILNAGITVDANIVRVTKIEQEKLIDPSLAFEEGHEHLLHQLNPFACRMMRDGMQQARFGWMALNMVKAPGMNVDAKEYTSQFITQVVAHEMGHILGLRHNFIASAKSTLAQLGDAEYVKNNGTSASVMDYIPFNLAAVGKNGVPFWSTTVGAYDRWAIKYGYSDLNEFSPAAELPKLRSIASQGNKPGLAYLSDEMAFSGWDPSVTQFDLGSVPLDYYSGMMRLSKTLWARLDQFSPAPGESYEEFTNHLFRLLNTYAASASRATRFIGGVHANRNHRGDYSERATLVTVSYEQQKAALALLRDHIFAEDALNVPRRFYGKLASDPYDFMQSNFPMRDTISNVQTAALRRLFRQDVLSRVVNNEFKAGPGSKALTLPTLFNEIHGAVWSEIDGKRNVGPLRRQLQRSYVELMTGMLVNDPAGVPADAKMLAWDQLRTLKHKLNAAKGAQYDTYTRVHIDELLMRVNRALSANQTVGGNAPASQQNLLELLLGGQEGAGATAR